MSEVKEEAVYVHQQKRNIPSIFSKASFVFLCILMIDCSIFGPGRMIMLGPVSIRMMILGILLIFSIPEILLQYKRILHSPFFCCLLAFILWMLICAVIGFKNGNKYSLILSDLKGFSYFVLLLAALVLLDDEVKIHTLMKCIMYGSFALALFIILLLCSWLWYKPFVIWFTETFRYAELCMISEISPTNIRLFFKSSPYLICGCAFSIYLQVKREKDRLNWGYPFITGVLLFALLLSYTRSLYLAAFTSAGLIIIIGLLLSKEKRKKLIVHLISAVAVFCLITAFFSACSHTDYFRYALKRIGVTFGLDVSSDSVNSSETSEDAFVSAESDNTADSSKETSENTSEPFSESTDEEDESSNIYDEVVNSSDFLERTSQSDEYRQMTLSALWELIHSSPVVGHGLGTELLSPPREHNEYFYLDLVAKSGIIGLILYLLPVLVMVIEGIQIIIKDKSDFFMPWAWLISLAGFMMFSYFNPYMNAALGVLFYSCTMAVFQFASKRLAQPIRITSKK